ncbi:MAG: hypothetical protein ABEK42_04195 [Thiohalorhabdaceae bacterium]
MAYILLVAAAGLVFGAFRQDRTIVRISALLGLLATGLIGYRIWPDLGWGLAGLFVAFLFGDVLATNRYLVATKPINDADSPQSASSEEGASSTDQKSQSESGAAEAQDSDMPGDQDRDPEREADGTPVLVSYILLGLAFLGDRRRSDSYGGNWVGHTYCQCRLDHLPACYWRDPLLGRSSGQGCFDLKNSFGVIPDRCGVAMTCSPEMDGPSQDGGTIENLGSFWLWAATAPYPLGSPKG